MFLCTTFKHVFGAASQSSVVASLCYRNSLRLSRILQLHQSSYLYSFFKQSRKTFKHEYREELVQAFCVCSSQSNFAAHVLRMSCNSKSVEKNEGKLRDKTKCASRELAPNPTENFGLSHHQGRLGSLGPKLDNVKQIIKHRTKTGDASVKKAEAATKECLETGVGVNNRQDLPVGKSSDASSPKTPGNSKPKGRKKRRRGSSASEQQQQQQQQQSSSPGSYRTNKKWRRLHRVSQGEHKNGMPNSDKLGGVVDEQFWVTMKSKRETRRDTGLIPAVQELFDRFQNIDSVDLATQLRQLELENQAVLGSEADLHAVKMEIPGIGLDCNRELKLENQVTLDIEADCNSTNSMEIPDVLGNLNEQQKLENWVGRGKETSDISVVKVEISGVESSSKSTSVFGLCSENHQRRENCNLALPQSVISDKLGEFSNPHIVKERKLPFTQSSRKKAHMKYGNDISSMGTLDSHCPHHVIYAANPQCIDVEANYVIHGTSQSTQENATVNRGQSSIPSVLSQISKTEHHQQTETTHTSWHPSSTDQFSARDTTAAICASPGFFCEPPFFAGTPNLMQVHPAMGWPFMCPWQGGAFQQLLGNTPRMMPGAAGLPFGCQGVSHFHSQGWQGQDPTQNGPGRGWKPGVNLLELNKPTCPEVTDTLRSWHQIRQAPNDRNHGGMELTVMSYNILAQDLLEMHTDLYTRCHSRDVQWPHRGAAILRQIISHNADIVCLQEVQADHWKQDIRPVLESHGYYGVFKRRTSNDKPDGCAILYKQAKFTHLKYVPVQFLQGGILDRDNVGIILLLRPNPDVYFGSAEKICVATTHLLFNPRRGDVKLAQLVMFLAEIDRVAALEVDEEMLKKSGGGRSSKRNEKQLNDGGGHRRVMVEHKECELPLSSQAPEKVRPGKTGVTMLNGLMVPNALIEDSYKGEPNESQGTVEKKSSRPFQSYCPIVLCGDFNTEPFCDLYDFVTKGELKYEGLVSRLICGQSEGRGRGPNITLGSHLLPSHLGISESCQYIQVLLERHRLKQTSKDSSRRRRKSRWDHQGSEDHHGHESGSTSSSNSGPEEMKSSVKKQWRKKNRERETPTEAGHESSGSSKCSFESEKQAGALHPNSNTNAHKHSLSESGQNSIAHEDARNSKVYFVRPKTNSGQIYHSMNFKSAYPHVAEPADPSGEMLWEVSSQHERCSCTVDYIFYSSDPVRRASNLKSSSVLGDKPRHSSALDHSCHHHKSDSRRNRETSDSKYNDGRGKNDLTSCSRGAHSSRKKTQSSFEKSDTTSSSSSSPSGHSPHSDSSRSRTEASPVEGEERQLELLARYSLLTGDQAAQTGHLPNATLPSDHLCLIAKFFLR